MYNVVWYVRRFSCKAARHVTFCFFFFFSLTSLYLLSNISYTVKQKVRDWHAIIISYSLSKYSKNILNIRLFDIVCLFVFFQKDTFIQHENFVTIGTSPYI